MKFSKVDESFVDMLCHTIYMCEVSNYEQHVDDLIMQVKHLLYMLERKGITDIGNNPVHGD